METEGQHEENGVEEGFGGLTVWRRAKALIFKDSIPKAGSAVTDCKL